VRCIDDCGIGAQGSVKIAKVAHLRMDGLPQGVDPLLDGTATYEPLISTGAYPLNRGLRHDGQPDARRRPDPPRQSRKTP
jgi:hypothetical protein